MWHLFRSMRVLPGARDSGGVVSYFLNIIINIIRMKSTAVKEMISKIDEEESYIEDHSLKGQSNLPSQERKKRRTPSNTLRKQVKVTVTLEENGDKSASNSDRSSILTPYSQLQSQNTDLPKNQVSGSQTSRILNLSKSSLFRKPDQTILGAAAPSRNLILGGGLANNQTEIEKKAANTRSLSSKFLNAEDDASGGFPQLTARVVNETKATEQLVQDINNQNQLSRTLYKVEAHSNNTMIGGLKFINPFKRRGDKIEIPEQRSLSSISFAHKTTSLVEAIPDQSRFKNYLPNIVRQKINGDTKRYKVVTVAKKEAPQQEQAALRQDVSFLQEVNTPNQKPSVLTTGDRGQDDLLEATLNYRNLGKSLINLPQTLEDLGSMVKALSNEDNAANIFNLIQMPDEEERLMERYLKDNFDPIESLEQLQEQGKLDQKVLLNLNLPTTKLSQYLNMSKTSPRRLYLNNTSPGQNFFNFQDKPLEKLNADPPFIDAKPQQQKLLTSKLMRKYGEEAFIHSQMDLVKKQPKTVHSSNKKEDIPVSTTLFGEQPRATSGTPPRYQLPQDLGNPSSRQDALILIGWYEKMLKQIVDQRVSGKIKDDKLYPYLQMFFNITMKELTRQISVHCHERGQLLTRVFGCYIRFLELLNGDHIAKRKKLKHDYALKLDRYVTIQEHQAQSYRDQISHLEERLCFTTCELDDLQNKHRDVTGLAQKYKRKCLNQARDAETNMTKIRYLEKENKQLKFKLQEIRDDFQLEVTDLDDKDRMRIMIEVEREMQDLERESKLQQQKLMSLSRTSGMVISEEELLQFSDHDLIGTDERQTCTDDFDEHLRKINGKRFRQKECQTEQRQGKDFGMIVNIHDMGAMVDKVTETMPQKEKQKKRVLSVIEEEEEKTYELQEYSDSDSSCSEHEEELDSNPMKAEKSSNNDSNSGEKETSLIEYLAKTLVQRANQLLERENERIEKLAESLPAQITEQMRKSLKETTNDVENIKNEIRSKHKEVKRSLRNFVKAEQNLKQANFKLDNLEMDNYNLRENFNEQLKMLDDYKNVVVEIQSIVESPEKPENSQRLKELIIQLKDLINSSQQKAFQITAEDTDNVLSIMLGPQGPTLVVMDDQQIVVTSNKGSKQHVSTNNNDSKRGFKFKDFNFGKYRSQAKIKGTHAAYGLLKKVLAKDPSKMKDVMPRKMLLRVIYQVYNERGAFESIPEMTMNQIQNTQSVSSQQQQFASGIMQNQTQSAFQTSTNNLNQAVSQQQNSLLEWIYDNFMQKYGLKNVADRKFVQLISSCIVYREQLHRINLFGRFLEIFDDLPASDYNRYLKLSALFQQQILNFKFDDDADSTLFPLARAQDYFKFKFEQKLIHHVFHHKMHMIDRMKVMVNSEESRVQKHLKGINQAVDYDWFIQFVIDTYLFIQEDRDQQIKEVFQAIDVGSTGMMSAQEFENIMKLCYLKSSKYIQRLFEEFSLPLEPQVPGSIRMLNFENFYNLSMERDLFTPKVLFTIIKSKNPEKDFEMLTTQLASVVSLFRARLVTMELIESRDHLDMLDNLTTCVKYSANPRVAWLCYRLTDEILKRMFLKHQAEQIMPVDLSLITEVKLKPSQALASNLPINYFDTQH